MRLAVVPKLAADGLSYVDSDESLFRSICIFRNSIMAHAKRTGISEWIVPPVVVPAFLALLAIASIVLRQ